MRYELFAYETKGCWKVDTIILIIDGQPVQVPEGKMPGGGGDDLDDLF
jgi:hypothetical protein